MKNKYFPIEVYCHLNGDLFNPNELMIKDDNVSITDIKTKGEIGKNGFYKDKKYPYGSCVIKINDCVKTAERIMKICEFLKNNKKELELKGVDDFLLWIYWFGIQGNMELSIKELKILSEIKMPLNMNYVYINEDDEIIY